MLALFKASEAARSDRHSSTPVDAPSSVGPRKQPSRWEVDGAQPGASE